MSEMPKFEIEVKKGDSQSSSTVSKDIFIIGRAPTCDVVIDHPQVSREHLRIELKGQNTYVIDLGSSHGTTLNGKDLTPKKAYPYTLRDELVLAHKAVVITIDQISKAQTDISDIELSSPDFSIPKMPVATERDPKKTGAHFLGVASQVRHQSSEEPKSVVSDLNAQVNASQIELNASKRLDIEAEEQLRQLIQKREAEEQMLQQLAENQRTRHDQLEQIIAQISTLDEKHQVEKSRLQEMLRDITKVENDIRESRQHLDKINTETKDLFSIKEQVRTEVAALEKHKHNLGSVLLSLDEEKITQQKKLQDIQEKIFTEQKQMLEFTEKRTVYEALVERLTNEQKGLTQQCNDLRLQNQTVSSETLKLQTQKQNLQADLNSLNQQMTDVNKSLAESLRRISELESLKAEEPELKANIERSREKLRGLNEKNKLAEVEQEKVAKALDAQKAELALAKTNAEAEVTRIRSQRDVGIRELENLNKQVESAQQTLKDSIARSNKLNDEMHQLDIETRKSTKAAADKLADVHKMELLLSELKAQITSSKEDITKLQDERRSLDQYVTQIRTNIENERKTLLGSAEDVANKLIEQKKSEADQILKQAKNNARIAVDEIHRESLLKTHQAEEKANRIIQNAKDDAQKLIDAAHGKSKILESEYEKEQRERRLALDQELVVLRLKETEELRRFQSQEEKKWLDMKETEVKTVKEILKAQLRLVLREKLEGPSERDIDSIAEKVEETFIDVLDTEFLKQDDNSTGPTPIYHPEAFKKEKLSWGQWAFKYRIPLSLGFFAAAIPLVQKGLITYHESNKIAQEKSFKDMAEQREIASRVEFETSEDYKNTFVDNILYTTNFTETISDPEYKEELVRKLDVFINKELDLHEEIVPIFMGKETELVMNLLNIKDKIKQQNKDASMKAMKKLESEFNQVMLDNLGSSDNQRKLKKFLKDFYINYRENKRNPLAN